MTLTIFVRLLHIHIKVRRKGETDEAFCTLQLPKPGTILSVQQILNVFI